MEWIRIRSTKLDFANFENELLPQVLSASSESRFGVDLSQVEFVDLSGLVPLVTLSDRLAATGIQIDFALPGGELESYFDKAGWVDAIQGLPSRRSHGSTYTRLSWFDSSEQCNSCVRDAMDVLARVSEFPDGVLDGIKWTIDELTDNVLVHSGGAKGWIQLVSRPKNGHVHLVVADGGRGIVNTIREGFPDLGDDCAALELAVERGRTRDKSIGQGNGLAGSLRISQALRGYVNIISGGATLRQNPQGLRDLHSNAEFPGTVATLTLSTDAEIDVSDALWGAENGYKPAAAFEHSHVEFDGIVFRLFDESTGFGNRASGEALVNKLRNIASGSPDERVIIDFADVDLASASFLDEFLAKLIRREGVTTFFGRYSFRNMNDLIRRTTDQVIAQRLASDE